MPELPEVETVRQYLADNITNTKILGIQLYRNSLRYQLNTTLLMKAIGADITSIQRRAKFLVINLVNAYSMVIHLGMSGKLTIQLSDYIPQKHDHVVIKLSNNTLLVFNDIRRFGMIYLCKTHELEIQKYLQNLGPEPLSKQFNANYLWQKLAFLNRCIKPVIMDSKIVVGIGNIYAAESLFLARINPQRTANSLDLAECRQLVRAIKHILTNAIKAGGTTLRDFVGYDNQPGYFKQELKVYGRDKAQCSSCGNLVTKIIQSGRSSFFCTFCQR